MPRHACPYAHTIIPRSQICLFGWARRAPSPMAVALRSGFELVLQHITIPCLRLDIDTWQFFLYSFGLFSMCRIRIRGDEREPVAAALTAATRVYIDGLRTCRWSEPLGTQVPERESKSGKCTLCCLTPIYYYYTKTLFGVCQLRKAATSYLCCALLNYRPSLLGYLGHRIWSCPNSTF